MTQAAPLGTLPAIEDVASLEDLRVFVHLLLCEKENLLEHHFPMTELELKKGSDCCGYQYILHGPRSVKLSAVWDRIRNEVLLYDAVGSRYRRISLKREVAMAT